MTFVEWLEGERKRLIAFEEMWREEAAKDADVFPMQMNPGDWDDQYLHFNEEQEMPDGCQ